MNTNHLFLALATTGVICGLAGVTRSLFGTPDTATASLAAPAPDISPERGRHLIRISGCNDCHTPGFMENPNVPEDEWLIGSDLGWRGPWGTTYPSNLRRHLAAWEDAGAWIEMVRSRHGLPPMPWPSLHAMTDDELRAIHAYIRSLPLKGDVMPPPVPPDRTPTTPWLNLQPVMPE